MVDAKKVKPSLKEFGTVKISDGRVVTIFKGKGKHSFKATSIANGDGSLYTKALMSLLVEFDGKPVTMEEFDELDLPDLFAIQDKFNDANFTSHLNE